MPIQSLARPQVGMVTGNTEQSPPFRIETRSMVNSDFYGQDAGPLKPTHLFARVELGSMHLALSLAAARGNWVEGADTESGSERPRSASTMSRVCS